MSPYTQYKQALNRLYVPTTHPKSGGSQGMVVGRSKCALLDARTQHKVVTHALRCNDSRGSPGRLDPLETAITEGKNRPRVFGDDTRAAKRVMGHRS